MEHCASSETLQIGEACHLGRQKWVFVLRNHGKGGKMERFFAILKMFLCGNAQIRLNEQKDHVIADLFKRRKLGGDGVQSGQR